MTKTAIVDLTGPEITAEEKKILEHPCVAGVILFERNVVQYHRESLIHLTQTLHDMRPDMFIMTDHEGGNVQRFRRMGFRPLMSAGSIGRAYALNPEVGLQLAYQEGQAMAKDLLDAGIDLSLAPVIDLETNQCSIIGGLDRAFHQDPEHITRLAQSYIEGMHTMHMPAVGKHFPGHGSCEGDSHRTLPVLDKTREALDKTDLKPFIELIHRNVLDAIMPAHVVYPAIDRDYATTYSSTWLHTILRDELSFKGIVISDCLGMKGADIGTLSERAERALEAGCDLLIVANQPRSTLAALLNTLPNHAHRDTALDRFKSKMARFNGNLISSQVKTTPSMTQENFDPQNPTETV